MIAKYHRYAPHACALWAEDANRQIDKPMWEFSAASKAIAMYGVEKECSHKGSSEEMMRWLFTLLS